MAKMIEFKHPFLNRTVCASLKDFLKPRTYCNDGDIERIRARLDATESVVGALLAHLVESDSMSLETAQEIAGNSDKVTGVIEV